MSAPFSTPSLAESRPFARFTSRDYKQMLDAGAFEGMRVELVDGVLEKRVPSGWKHGEANATLAVLLKQAYEGTGARIGIDVIVELDASTTRACDLVVVVPAFDGDRPLTPPDVILAVEIADTSLSRDLGEKSVAYARSGIATLWIVDINNRAVIAMTDASNDGYTQRLTIPFGEDIAVPGTLGTIALTS